MRFARVERASDSLAHKIEEQERSEKTQEWECRKPPAGKVLFSLTEQFSPACRRWGEAQAEVVQGRKASDAS